MAENSTDVAADIAALLKARSHLLWLVTNEEARVEPFVFEAVASVGYVGVFWDCGAGVRALDGRPIEGFSNDLGDTLDAIMERAQRERTGNDAAPKMCFVMRDLPPWIGSDLGLLSMMNCRKVKNLARLLPSLPLNRSDALIVLSPSNKVPAELANSATVIEWPMPDRKEMGEILDLALQGVPEEMRAVNGTRERAIDAAIRSDWRTGARVLWTVSRSVEADRADCDRVREEAHHRR